MAENVDQILSSPPTPEVGPVEYSRPEYQALADAASTVIDSFALAKMRDNLSDVESQTENYYETSLALFDKIESAPDMQVQDKFRQELQALQAGEVQGILDTAAVDARQDALAQSYLIRFPHLEGQIQSMMTSVRAGSSGRAKQAQMVNDPYIEYRKKMFGLSAETRIPIPFLKDMAQRDRILQMRKAELEYAKAMGESLQGKAFVYSQQVAAKIVDGLWDVIRQDAAGNKIGTPSYNTAQGRQQLLAASQGGRLEVLNTVAAELDKAGIPVTKELMESVYARWEEGVNEFEFIVDNGNNYEVIDQLSKMKDIFALDELSKGSKELRLMLKNPDLWNVFSGISHEARKAFNFGPDGSRTPKESGYPQLRARALAGDPIANLTLTKLWTDGDGKVLPDIVNHFDGILNRGDVPENVFAPGSPLSRLEEMDTSEKIKKAVAVAATPESLRNTVQATLKHEPSRKALLENPKVLMDPRSTLRNKTLADPAFMRTQEGQYVADAYVQVFADRALEILRDSDIADITELTRTGPADAPFVWRGAPKSKKFVTGPRGGVIGAPVETIEVTENPGADAAQYLNEAYQAIKSYDPARAEAYLNDMESETKKAARRKADAVRATTPANESETVFELTDEDFADLE